MPDVRREFGVVGLERMGANLSLQALEKGINFIDLGTSGGVEGARHGACFMAGGRCYAYGGSCPGYCTGCHAAHLLT